MLRFLLSLRFVLLAAALGTLAGALLMFFEGGAKLAGALRIAHTEEAGGRSAIGLVMGATDAFLFGVVLTIFAYAIAFGFVFQLGPAARRIVPAWMQVEGVGALKRLLFEVILVYLVVDFATDVAESETHLTWQTLVMPASILLLAAALRLLGGGHAERPPAPDEPAHR